MIPILQIQQVPEYGFVYDERTTNFIRSWQKAFKVQETIQFVKNITFDDVTTSFKSEWFETGKYKYFDLFTDVDVTGTPTLLTIIAEFSDDGSNWYKLTTGPFSDLSYGNAAGDLKEVIQGKVNSPYMRIRVTTSGTSSSATFKLNVKANFSS